MSGEHAYSFALSICSVKDVVTGMRLFWEGLWKREGSRSKSNPTLEGQFTKSGDRHRSCCSRIPMKPRTRIRRDPAFSNGRISHVSGLVAFDAAQKISGGNGEYVTSNDCICCCDLDVVFSVMRGPLKLKLQHQVGSPGTELEFAL